MGITYHTVWDMTKLDDTFSLTFSSFGETTFYIKHSGSGESNTYYLEDYDANAADLYSHYDFHDMVKRGETATPFSSTHADDTFGNILKEALTAAITAEGWSGTWYVVLSSTGKYFLNLYEGPNWELDGQASSLRLLGFTSSQSGSNNYTSEYAASHLVVSELDHISKVSDEYERNEVASLAISDGGDPVGIARTVPIVYLDWEQPFEPHASTHNRKSGYQGSGVNLPWTFQNLFEHCRTVYPIMPYTDDLLSSSYPVVYLRDDGAAFKPTRAIPDNDVYWHIPFRTYLYGWL